MPKVNESMILNPTGGGARRRIWLAMATVFTLALVISLAYGLYGIAKL